jgi:hypothetical protein
MKQPSAALWHIAEGAQDVDQDVVSIKNSSIPCSIHHDAQIGAGRRRYDFFAPNIQGCIVANEFANDLRYTVGRVPQNVLDERHG